MNIRQLKTPVRGKKMKQNNQEKLLVITCKCGFQIPVTSDAEAVGNAIDRHVEEHKNRHKNPEEAEKEAEQIQELLFSKLFQKIAQITI
jgi:hypothetical protein